MRVAYCSDLHTENSAQDIVFPEADVLLLAGDICVVADLREAFCETVFGSIQRQFLIEASAKYDKVLWVFGNHEIWDGCIETVEENVKDFLKVEGIKNITFGQKGSVTIQDVKFVFATLWTDVNRGNPLDLVSGRSATSDYQHIMKGDDSLDSGVRYLSPEDTVDMHNAHKQHIIDQIKGHEKVVVMTHHAPNMISSGPHVAKRSSYYYCCTDMDDLIMDSAQIKFWVSGHTHNRIKYTIGDTQVISNPRGYASESMSKDFAVGVFDV